jgi:hypothetical protein
MPMTRPARVVAAGLAIVLVAGLVALICGPARGARGDIATQKKLIAAQLAAVREQLEIQRQQLALAREQRAIAQQTLDVARQTLGVATQTRDLAAQTLTVARGTNADADLQLTLSRSLASLVSEIESIARATLAHAANLDRKTGPAPPGR